MRVAGWLLFGAGLAVMLYGKHFHLGPDKVYRLVTGIAGLVICMAGAAILLRPWQRGGESQPNE